MFAPESASKCNDCGSSLEKTTAGRWCDFCCDLKGDKVSIDELLSELDRLSEESKLTGNKEARDLVDSLLLEVYDDGYENGLSDADCDDAKW